MKVTIINCFPSIENNRVIPIMEYYEKHGNEAVMLTSNFHHYNKEKVILNRKNIVQLNVLEYKKNLSLSRIFSHIIFSKKVYKYFKKNPSDIVYVKIPPNFLLHYLKKLKKRKRFFLIGDIYDLWPESMPSLQKKNGIFHVISNVWKNVRENNLDCIDFTIYECDLYKKFIKNKGSYDTLYLCRDDYINFCIHDNSNISEVVRLCYLGNVGQLVDLDLLEKFIIKLTPHRKIEFHIIGDGNSKISLINILKSHNVSIMDHGVVFADNIKRDIMQKCDFGLNFMKKELIIGLSNKSIDYFKCGLPILNTINSDTKYLISNFNAGYTVEEKSVDYMINWIISLDNNLMFDLKCNARKLYLENFTKEIFVQKYDKINKYIQQTNSCLFKDK